MSSLPPVTQVIPFPTTSRPVAARDDPADFEAPATPVVSLERSGLIVDLARQLTKVVDTLGTAEPTKSTADILPFPQGPASRMV